MLELLKNKHTSDMYIFFQLGLTKLARSLFIEALKEPSFKVDSNYDGTFRFSYGPIKLFSYLIESTTVVKPLLFNWGVKYMIFKETLCTHCTRESFAKIFK